MAGWQTYTMAPLDTLFFRDGRPFVAGEGTDAMSIFPPTPLTLQGLVRSKLLARQRPAGGGGRGDGCGLWANYAHGCTPCAHNENCDVQQVVGRLGKPCTTNGTLRLRGPWVLIGGGPFVPIPLDVVAKEEDLKAVACGTSKEVQTGLLRPGGRSVSNHPGGLRPLDPPRSWDKFGGVPGWMSWSAFETYLQGKPPTLALADNWWRPEDVGQSELRPGLQIEDGRSRAEEGLLYFARHVRLNTWDKDIHLAVELDGLGNQERSLTQFPATPFGGERRAIALGTRQPDDAPWRTMPSAVAGALASRRIKLVLVQPAWFKQGWIPRDWKVGAAQEEGTAHIHGAKAAWVACAMDRPDRFGGWDLARGDQKPVRAFVPRRTVYYLRIDSAADVQKIAGLWGQGFSETPDGEPFAFDQMGFGHVFLGTWQEATHV